MVFFIAQGIDAHLGAGRVEDTHDHLLSEQRRAGAYAEVDGPVARQGHLDAAILRDAALGDVQPRHDLQARSDAASEISGRCGNLVQNAVRAEAHPEDLLVGLEVDVGRPPVDGIQQDLVHEAHDRRFVDF